MGFMINRKGRLLAARVADGGACDDRRGRRRVVV